MYRSVLVPVDGSSFAEQALPLALSIARRAGAALKIVQVHLPWKACVEEEQRAYLSTLIKRLECVPTVPVATVPITSAIVEGFTVAEALDTHVGVTGADLIVMTTHGRGPFSRFWLGSVADAVVRTGTTPVLLLRPQTDVADFTTEPVLRHILIPVDRSRPAEAVLRLAESIGGLMEARYSLLHVYGPGLDADNHLTSVVEPFQRKGYSIQAHAVPGEHPAHAILATAQRLAVDLIAMETRGHSGWTRLLSGSVAGKILQGSSIPVLLRRSPGIC